MTNRFEMLKNLAAQNPTDSFIRYGLAMEYVNKGDLEQAAKEFREILSFDPDYSAAYYHGGQTLEKLGRDEDARELYQQGIAATLRTGDAHTRSELQAALDLLA